MDQMNPAHVLHVSVEMVNSSAKTTIAPWSPLFVMVETTVETTAMRKSAAMSAPNMSSSVPMENAFWVPGNATETPTVWMDPTKMNAICENATRRPNSRATTENASSNCGTVTLTTIAGMTVTSLLIFAVNETAQMDGGGARTTTTTDVFLSGCFVMEKMTAEMARMSCRRIVRFVLKRENSPAGR